jgi:hypothetical protein
MSLTPEPATPFTVTAKAPLRFEVIDAKLVAACNDTIAKANLVKEVTDANAEAVNGLAVVLSLAEGTIEDQRKAAKAPYLEVGRIIDEISKKLSEPVTGWKKRLQALLLPYNKKKEAEKAAAELLVAQEKAKAEAAAEVERQRLQKEADAKHAAEVAEAQRLADEDAAELAKIMGKKAAPAPKVELPPPPAVVVIPAAVTAPAPPVIRQSAVGSRIEKRLVIDDPKAVAAQYSAGLFILVKFDEATIKRCLIADPKSVAGAHLEDEEVAVMKSRT